MIHIPDNIKKKITFLIGESNGVVNIPSPVYEKSRITFLSDFSKALLKVKSIREYPDVVTFGFWCKHAWVSANTRGYLIHLVQTRVGICMIYRHAQP